MHGVEYVRLLSATPRGSRGHIKDSYDVQGLWKSVSVKAMAVLSISASFLFKVLVLTRGGPTAAMAASHFDSEL